MKPSHRVRPFLGLFLVAGFCPTLDAGEIHDAIARGEFQKVQSLLSADPKLANTAEEATGFTPLLLAVQEGKKDLIQLLLDSNADINGKDTSGNTALRWATILEGRSEIASYLVKKGASFDIFSASALGKVEIVKSILAKDRSQANPQTQSIVKPIHLAAREGQAEIVQLLITYGADPNQKSLMGDTPLHGAAKNSCKEVVSLLLDRKVDVNATNKNKQTPLHLAAQYGTKEIVEILLSAGADIKVTNWRGNTPLHCAILGNKLENVRLILSRKADVNTLSKDGTPLHITAWSSGNREIAELLIAQGADVNAKDHNGKTPIQLSKEYGNKAVTEVLVAHGANE